MNYLEFINPIENHLCLLYYISIRNGISAFSQVANLKLHVALSAGMCLRMEYSEILHFVVLKIWKHQNQ